MARRDAQIHRRQLEPLRAAVGGPALGCQRQDAVDRSPIVRKRQGIVQHPTAHDCTHSAHLDRALARVRRQGVDEKGQILIPVCHAGGEGIVAALQGLQLCARGVAFTAGGLQLALQAITPGTRFQQRTSQLRAIRRRQSLGQPALLRDDCADGAGHETEEQRPEPGWKTPAASLASVGIEDDGSGATEHARRRPSRPRWKVVKKKGPELSPSSRFYRNTM